MDTKKFQVSYPWDTSGYTPRTIFELGMNDDGFLMHITVYESDPRREQREHQKPVHWDSCVEWFVNFCPECCDRYFNFEMNANGAVHVAFRKNRSEYRLLTHDEIDMLDVKTIIGRDVWEVTYAVPFSLIQKYIPDYQFQEGMRINANFYKCGDLMEFPHYGVWSEIPVETPDFHRPEYFGIIELL